MSLDQPLQFLDVLDYSSQLLQDLNQRLSESTFWIRDRAFYQPLSIKVQETGAVIVLKAQFHTSTHSLTVQVNQETVLIKGKRWEPTEKSMSFEPEFSLCCFQSMVSLPKMVQPESAIVKLNANQLTITMWKAYQVLQHGTTNLSDQEVTVGTRKIQRD